MERHEKQLELIRRLLTKTKTICVQLTGNDTN